MNKNLKFAAAVLSATMVLALGSCEIVPAKSIPSSQQSSQASSEQSSQASSEQSSQPSSEASGSQSSAESSSASSSASSSSQSSAEVIKYKVTFEAGEGALPPGAQKVVEVPKGEGIQLPVPSYQGHTFIGWFTGTGPSDGQFYNYTPVGSNLTLYARYSSIVDYVLDASTQLEAADNGFVQKAEVGGIDIDVIGYKAKDKAFGTIARMEADEKHTYNGLIFNRSMVTGLTGINVSYTGGDLYCVFTDSLLEDLSFARSATRRLRSGNDMAAPEGYRYFLIYTDSESPVEIANVAIKVDTEEPFFEDRLYGAGEEYYGNRSLAKTIEFTESTIVLENNPLANNNNYSQGKTGGHANNDSWYRWNGICLSGEGKLKAKTFDLQTTIIGDYTHMLNEDKYFNYSIWFEFKFWNGTQYEKGAWAYAFMGNDNYEPLGHLDPERINKDHSDNYPGRFFTNYDDSYNFQDPDVATTADGLTYRQAFEDSPYPYWNISFHIENNHYTATINGHQMPQMTLWVEEWLEYDVMYTNQDIEINRVELCLVNYGNPDGSPMESYSGTFTKPRIK